MARSMTRCGSRLEVLRALRLLLSVTIVCALLTAAGAISGAPPAGAAPATTASSATETIPVPPASSYAGSGGGDGWAVALSANDVYNVFHHQATLQFACHLQSTAASCYAPETITDASGDNFATSGQPGLWMDQATGHLYVFATGHRT